MVLMAPLIELCEDEKKETETLTLAKTSYQRCCPGSKIKVLSIYPRTVQHKSMYCILCCIFPSLRLTAFLTKAV